MTLSAGFWLADTACTQALWEAVMGNNPSHFHAKNGGGPQHPVEQVSWDDVQRFLRALEKRLPGVIASLPSEAEWEYACRAGTPTPFIFRDQITPEQVNYDGNYPYAGGSTGLYRESTVAVGSLPANAWGLYESTATSGSGVPMGNASMWGATRPIHAARSGGQEDAVRRAERIIRLQSRGIHLDIQLISPIRPAERYS